MGQADSRLITRRLFSATLLAAATVPAIAITTPAVEATDWQQFEPALHFFCEQMDAIDDDTIVAEKARADWERRNPFPLSGVVSDERAWAVRYEQALRQCGAGKLRKQRELVYARYSELLKRIADTPVRTLEDLRAKTRLARFDSTSGSIWTALARDIDNI